MATVAVIVPKEATIGADARPKASRKKSKSSASGNAAEQPESQPSKEKEKDKEKKKRAEITRSTATRNMNHISGNRLLRFD